MSKYQKFPKESGISVARVFGDGKRGSGVEEDIPIKDLDNAETVEEAPVITDDKEPINKKSGKLVDGCNLLNMRKRPSMDSDVVSIIRVNDKIDILPDPIDIEPGWASVSVNGTKGFVIRKFIEEV